MSNVSQDVSQVDTTIDIVTPENIAFHYQIAGPFRRLPAYGLDLLIRLVIVWLTFFIVACSGIVIGFGPAVAIWMIAWFVVEWFYGGLFETYMNGQTPGKMAMGLRVLSVDGRPVTGTQAVLRNILRYVDMFPLLSLAILGVLSRPLGGESMPDAYVIPTYLFALGAMTMTSRFQRLGDLVCGTVVVVDQPHWLAGLVKLDDPRAAQLAAYLPADLRISRSMARALAMYVERRRYFSEARRREVARHLAEPLMRRFGFSPDTSSDLLLCALYYRAFVADHADDVRREVRQEAASESPFSGAALP